jgi:uncharacterized protein YjbI with pentapeptide repeats
MNAETLLKQYAAGDREFSELNVAGQTLSGAILSGSKFLRANFSNAILNGTGLQQSQLHGARLEGAKLNKAQLQQAQLQQANLSRADLTFSNLVGANLVGANLSTAVLQRADLSGANLTRANLTGADLTEAKLIHCQLTRANLSNAELRRSVWTGAVLEQANLHSCDLSAAELVGANLGRAELRQANMARANLQGADLRGANLRWADLSGADLRWADLSGAVLSGANLTGADLSHATLIGTSLVHVDMTRATLIGVDWAGADLTGAQMTGVKLYDVQPFGAKFDEVTCGWVDLSPNGDRSKTYQFASADVYEFFYKAAPTVQVVVDERISPEACGALAVTYQQLARQANLRVPAPSLLANRRRTTLKFELEQDEQLFLAAFVAIFPFTDGGLCHQSLSDLVQLVPSEAFREDRQQLQRFRQMVMELRKDTQQVANDRRLQMIPGVIQKLGFFHAPTQTILINSSGQRLAVSCNPLFSRRSLPSLAVEEATIERGSLKFLPSSREQVVEFVKGFHNRG